MSGKTDVALRLIGLMASRPSEFVDRSRAVVENKLFKRWQHSDVAYQPRDWNDVLIEIGRRFDCDPASLLAEREYANAVLHHRAAMDPIKDDPPFPIEHNADARLSQLTYLAVRLLKPEIAIEAGVGYGMTTAIILTAMAKNGVGTLHSIDLPPLRKGAEDYIGIAVPEEYRGEWNLHRGTAVKLLPEIISRCPSIDLYIHDSLFTYRNTMAELSLVTPSLGRRAAVIVNCAEQSSAFEEWTAAEKPPIASVVHAESKEDLIGVAIFDK